MKKLSLLFLIIFYGLQLVAARIYLEEGGIVLWVPDNWKQTVEEDYIFCESSDKGGVITLEFLDAQTLDEALAEYPEVLSDYFDGLKISSKLQNLKLINHDALKISGSARYARKECNLQIYLIESEEGVLLLVCAGEKKNWAEYEQLFQKVVLSLEQKLEQKENNI